MAITAFALRFSSVQTFLINKITGSLAEDLNTEINIKRIDVAWYLDAKIKGVEVYDLNDEILLKSEEIRVDINYLKIFAKEYEIGSLLIKDGEFNLNKNKNDEGINLDFLVNHFKKPNGDTTYVVDLKSINLQNMKFNYDILDEDYNSENIFDPNHIGILFKDLYITDFQLTKKVFGGYIKKFVAVENSGLKILNGSGDILLSSNGIISQKLNLSTQNSILNIQLNWEFDNWNSFSDFNKSIKINTSLKNSKLSTTDLAYFSESFENTNDKILINGDLQGSLENLKLKNLFLKIRSKLEFEGSLRFNGLPDVENVFTRLKIKKLTTSINKLNRISIVKKYIQLPEELEPLGNIRVDGRFTGFFKDFVLNNNFYTDKGIISTNISLKPDGKNSLAYNGELETVNFKLGGFLNNPKIGAVSMKSNIKGKDFDKNADITANVVLESLNLNKTIYKNVLFNAEFKEQVLSANLVSKDKEFSLKANSTMNFQNKMRKYLLELDIKNAGIDKLMMLDADTLGKLSGIVSLELKGNKLNNYTGSVELKNAFYENQYKDISHKLEDLSINSVPFKNGRNIKLKSEFADASFNIGSDILSLDQVYYNIADNLLPTSIKPERRNKNNSKKVDTDQALLAKIKIKETDLITRLLLPDLKITNNLIVDGYYSKYKNTFELKLKGDTVKYRDYVLNNFNITTESDSSGARLMVKSENFGVNENIDLTDFYIGSTLVSDSLNYKIFWGNNTYNNSADIVGTAIFTDSLIKNTFKKNHFWIDSTKWSVEENNKLVYSSKSTNFHKFNFKSGNSKIELNGEIAEKGKLHINVNKFPLSYLDNILQKHDTRIAGRISGKVNAYDFSKGIKINSQLRINNFELNEYELGEAHFNLDWIDSQKAIKTDLEIINDNYKTLSVNGFVFPSKADSAFDLKIKLKDLPAGVLSPYVSSFSSEINGYADASIKMSGALQNPVFNGYIDSDIKALKIDYLNTTYNFTDRLYINEKGIRGENIKFYDKYKKSDTEENEAICNFELWYKNAYKTMGVDIEIDANNLLSLNNTAAQNDIFYGKAFTSGKVKINGPMDNLLMDIDIETENGTKISIPYVDKETAEVAEFINFINPNDTTNISEDNIINPIDEKSGISMKFNFNIKPNAVLRMVMNEATNEVLTTRGEGNLKINVDQLYNIEMYGSYNVERGDYLFTLEGLLNKKFELREGGTIVWDGDMMDATMDLEAVYETSAPLIDLIRYVDSSDIYKRDSKVLTVINIKGDLMSPEIAFDIELPDENENTKELVHNILYISDDKPNTSLINKNFVSLLLINSFLPPSGYGSQQAFQEIDLGGETTDILFNQLGNMVGSVSENLDVGIDYKAGDQVTTQKLALALNASLLDDRLYINGKVGSGGEEVGATTQRIVGDVLIEYKITPDGKIRARVFNRTNYDDVLTRRAPYTQGAGISFNRSIDSFKELFKKKKNKE